MNQDTNKVIISWIQSDDLGTYRIIVELPYCRYNEIQWMIAEMGGTNSDEEYLDLLVELCSDLDCREHKISNDTEYHKPSHINIEFL